MYFKVILKDEFQTLTWWQEKFRRQAAQQQASRVPEKVGAAAPVAALTTTTTTPPLGPLVNFKGVFKGTGFNTIFRPANGKPAPGPPNDNLLELNLTQETLTFSSPLGDVSQTTTRLPRKGRLIILACRSPIEVGIPLPS